ncbi:heavy-metal-associated domain-containing protein [Rufibacter sediminis]|uniref:Heavy-metal-associated domain-containing protein n=1 Tax=Rufibacter sediminis TaxID=2762756 RepID=A0ABR6VNY5_9BACT|nr:heavy metal-associated domain-containing protein [Rufibacter sediminis]MBC3538311.1 heavy-metal-associated domain-containing protein [Rufibacter sediminis]
MRKFLIISSILAFTQICGCGTCSLFAKPVGLSGTAIEVKKADVKTIQVKVTGLTCAGCASGLQKALGKQAGILSNEVQYPGDVATIKYDAAKVSEKQILAAIEKAGYKGQVLPETKSAGKTTSLKATGGCCAKKAIL